MARPVDLNARALDGIVHLVADHPGFTAAADGDKVGHPARKVFIVATVGNCAFGLIAVVQPADDPIALIAKGGKIDAPAIFGVVAKRFGKKNPPAGACPIGRTHIFFAARFVDAIDIRRINQRSRHAITAY